MLNLSIGGPDFMDQPFVDKVGVYVLYFSLLLVGMGGGGEDISLGGKNNPL